MKLCLRIHLLPPLSFPADFKEMTTECTTESLLDYQNCCLVIENVDVENVDLKIGQLLAGRSSLTGTVPKRSKNASSVPKRKMKFETKNKSGVPKRKTRIETNSEADYYEQEFDFEQEFGIGFGGDRGKL